MPRDAPPVRLRLRRPVDAGVEVRHRRQHVEAVASRRRHRGIGRGGPVQVEAEIGGEDLAPEDVAQQFAVARPEQDRVVPDRLVAPPRAEVPDEEAHGMPRPPEPPLRPAPPPVLGRQHLAVGPGGIGVRHHDVGRHRFAGSEHHARGPPVPHRDPPDLGAEPHRAARALDQADEAAHEAAGAALGPPHAPAPLQVRDQGVEAARGERIPADQQRVEGERHAQPLVPHMARNQAVDAAQPAEAQQVGHHARHRAEGAEGNMSEPLEADPASLFAEAHEPLVPRHVAGAEPRHLGAHRRRVGRAVEGGAVREAQPVEGRQGHQLDVVREAPAAERPKLLEQEGRGDDGGAGVEGEAVLPVDARPPARRMEPLQHRHPVAARAEPHRRGEAAEAAADHHGMGPPIRRHRCRADARRRRRIECQRSHTPCIVSQT